MAKTIYDRVIASDSWPGYIVVLSAPQGSSLGHIVGDIYYKRPQLLQIGINHLSGFPHNGGEHSMRVQGCRDDLIAWLNLVIETYREINYERFQEGCYTLGAIRDLVASKPNR